MNNDVYPLFPYPLMVCAKNYAFNNAEKEFFADLEMRANTGNSMSKDDKILDSAELAGLKEFIDQQITIYKKNLLHMKDDNEIYITQSWVNKSGPGQFHPKHKHHNSVVSGVMFLDDNHDNSLPALRFHRTFEMFPLEFSFDSLNEFNASCREFDPIQGMLMLFPSMLEHDVGPNQSGRIRRSLSFNTYARGKVGGRAQLTAIEIS